MPSDDISSTGYVTTTVGDEQNIQGIISNDGGDDDGGDTGGCENDDDGGDKDIEMNN